MGVFGAVPPSEHLTLVLHLLRTSPRIFLVICHISYLSRELYPPYEPNRFQDKSIMADMKWAAGSGCMLLSFPDIQDTDH